MQVVHSPQNVLLMHLKIFNFHARKEQIKVIRILTTKLELNSNHRFQTYKKRDSILMGMTKLMILAWVPEKKTAVVKSHVRCSSGHVFTPDTETVGISCDNTHRTLQVGVLCQLPLFFSFPSFFLFVLFILFFISKLNYLFHVPK